MPALLVSLAALADLLIWRLLPPGWQEVLFLPFLVLVSWVIFSLRLDLARQKRQVWLRQYLACESRLQRSLQLGWLSYLFNLCISLLLALLLLLQALILPWALALTLALSLPLVHFIQKGLNLWLLTQVKEEYRLLVSCHWLVMLLAPLLTALLTLVFLFQPQPWLLDISWTQAVNTHLDSSRSASFLGVLESSLQLVVLTQHWTMQNWIGDVSRSGWVAWVAWLLMVGIQTSLAIAFSYWLVAAHYLIKKLNLDEDKRLKAQ